MNRVIKRKIEFKWIRRKIKRKGEREEKQTIERAIKQDRGRKRETDRQRGREVINTGNEDNNMREIHWYLLRCINKVKKERILKNRKRRNEETST